MRDVKIGENRFDTWAKHCVQNFCLNQMMIALWHKTCMFALHNYIVSINVWRSLMCSKTEGFNRILSFPSPLTILEFDSWKMIVGI